MAACRHVFTPGTPRHQHMPVSDVPTPTPPSHPRPAAPAPARQILERKAPPTFPIVVELRARSFYVAHWAEDSVDALLLGRMPSVQVRRGAGAGAHWCWVLGARVRDLTA